MKGSTHTLIGIASASLIYNTNIKLARDPEIIIPFIFAYVGSLICDIDTGTSTVSNVLTPMKSKHIRKILMVLLIGIGILGSIYFRRTKYMAIFAASIILTAISITRVSKEIYSITRKISTIGLAVVTITIGIIYSQLPIILLGLLLGALVLSPHRGYSHSIVAVIGALVMLRYLFNYYKMNDYSLYFCIGMLSHIVADMFTDQGVMLLFPIRKKISFPIGFKTGSLIESLISGIAIFIMVFAFLGKSNII